MKLTSLPTDEDGRYPNDSLQGRVLNFANTHRQVIVANAYGFAIGAVIVGSFFLGVFLERSRNADLHCPADTIKYVTMRGAVCVPEWWFQEAK